LNDTARQTLIELVARYGSALADDPRRCEGLLRDFCGQHRREIFVLVSAARERVPADLMAAASVARAGAPAAIVRAQLAKRLQEQLALTEEAAQWAVETWAAALRAGGASTLPAPAGPESAALPAETVPACAGDGSDGGDSGDGGRAHSAARWAAGVGALWAGTGATLGATFSSLHGAGAERTTWLMLGALAGAILGAAAGALGRLAGGRLAGAIELAAGGTVGGAALGAALGASAGALAATLGGTPEAATASAAGWALAGAGGGAVLTALAGATSAAWKPGLTGERPVPATRHQPSPAPGAEAAQEAT
jgi:hypothetical protein